MSELKGSKKSMFGLISSKNFVATINSLIDLSGGKISETDNWSPVGSADFGEKELRTFLSKNNYETLGKDILSWWIKTKIGSTPNWDLISSCTINNQKGILLVEAKAHYGELKNERKRKSQLKSPSADSKANNESIGIAINQANDFLKKDVPSISLSRDKCYQLSNRIAHAWWLADHGIPVVLLYLGFLNAEDMNNGKYKLIETASGWEKCFLERTKEIGADKLLNTRINCGRSSFITICRAI